MARYYDYGDYYEWRPYVSQAERRAQALRTIRQMSKSGRKLSPVEIDGRKIAHTFWGGAWCDNLERYSDFANRLPRGRTYVRNGSVIDLQIEAGKVTALVSGSEIYEVAVSVTAVAAARWKAMCRECAGGIDSLVELLQGTFSEGVMELLCRQGKGLFPTPREMQFSCSCPDWAQMCKHVAAVLYGVGARLDQKPELLFRLRQVDEKELIASAGAGVPLSKKGPAASRLLEGEDLASVFGVDMAPSELREGPATKAPVKRGRQRRVTAAPLAEPPQPETRPAAKKREAGTATSTQAGSVPAGRSPGRHAAPGMSAAARRAVSERMKRYWAERRKALRNNRPPAPVAEGEAPPRARVGMTAAQRKAVSERMKRYWAERRKALRNNRPPARDAEGETLPRAGLTPAQRRKAQSELMKRYWAERRKASEAMGKKVADLGSGETPPPERRGPSARQRKTAVERMKRYWTERRKALRNNRPPAPVADGEAPPRDLGMTAAQRNAVSERMKRYWAERRKASEGKAGAAPSGPRAAPAELPRSFGLESTSLLVVLRTSTQAACARAVGAGARRPSPESTKWFLALP
jgi:uncharacterized Zn finger protein